MHETTISRTRMLLGFAGGVSAGLLACVLAALTLTGAGAA